MSIGDNLKEIGDENSKGRWRSHLHQFDRKDAASEYIFHKNFMLASVDLTSYQYSYRVYKHEIYIVKSSILQKLACSSEELDMVIQHMAMIKYGVTCTLHGRYIRV